MAAESPLPETLRRALATGRIPTAVLFAGPGDAPRQAARSFARALGCRGDGADEDRPCDACRSCLRSSAPEEIVLDGSGKKGPLLRHVGDHPDLYWVERGPDDTRVRIGQVRALQSALRLKASDQGWRAAVVADADQLNPEAQNALLRLLEEPPPRTAVLLVAQSAAGLLVTVRSRCQRIRFPAPRPVDLADPEAPEELRQLASRLDGLPSQGLPEILDWAEEYRGQRAAAAEEVGLLLRAGSAWLRHRVGEAARAGRRDLERDLDAFATLSACRKALVQRNANPQMVAERALMALREACA